jgi:kynurenine 3-monooxygenase
LQKKIEGKISALYPQHWLPLYSMVTFSDISYAAAKATGERQENIMAEIMPFIQSEADFDKPEVQQLIQKHVLGEEMTQNMPALPGS